jgi:signal transduction histidine kinase
MTKARLWGADAGLAASTVLPPLLMQPAADASARAWWLLAGFEAVAVAALMVRRRLPLTAFLVITTAWVAAVADGAAASTKLSPLLVLSLAVALYSVGNYCTGFAARSHRANLTASQQRVQDVLREQQLREQQAAQEERVRIAREMHDVVAHSITLLVVHAETLRARGNELPAWARTQIDGLALSGRQAGGELRDLLRVLHGPGQAAPLAPMPGLGDLPELLGRSQAAGARVAARIEVDVDALPRTVQLAGYRIVQEALTNARRYAPGAPVRVTLTVDAGRLRCEVVNARPEGGPGVVGLSSGLGLVSMRERVDALGGDLRAGATDDGGYAVVAVLPMSPAALTGVPADGAGA